MARFTKNPHRLDPYKNFKFRVSLDGRVIPGVSKISPLRRITDVVAHRGGGEQSEDRLSPGTTEYPPLTLERGITHDHTFEEWANMVFNLRGDGGVSLENYKKNLYLELLNLEGSTVLAFLVYGCWVSEYQALPELDANGECTAVEKIVLQHQGWERDTEVTEPEET